MADPRCAHEKLLAEAEAEVDRLRQSLAYEARAIKAQTDMAAIKGSRRQHIDGIIARMTAAVRGDFHEYAGKPYMALKSAVQAAVDADR